MLVDVGHNMVNNQNNQNQTTKNGQSKNDKHQQQNINGDNEQKQSEIKTSENDTNNQQIEEERMISDDNNKFDDLKSNINQTENTNKDRVKVENGQTETNDLYTHKQPGKDNKQQIQKQLQEKLNQNMDEKNKKFDPSRDLNIFEQINFDDMNINLEDINQSNQKQDVINSSNSDIDEDMKITYKQKISQDQYAQQKQNQIGLNDSAVSGFSDFSSQNQLNGQIMENMEFEENYSDEQEYLKEYQNNQNAIAQNSKDLVNQKQQKLQQENIQTEKINKELINDIDAAHQLDIQEMDMNNGFEMIKFKRNSSNSESQYEQYSNSKYSLVSGSQEDTPQQYQQNQNIERNYNIQAQNDDDSTDKNQIKKKSPIKNIQDKYNKIGQIGTELQVIESQSNEVSSSGCAISGIGEKDISQKQSKKGQQSIQLITDSQDHLSKQNKITIQNQQLSKDISESDDNIFDISIGKNLQSQKIKSQDNYLSDLQYMDILQNGFDEKQQDNFDFLDDEQSIDSNLEIEKPQEKKQKISQQLMQQDKLLEQFEQKNSKTLQMIQQEKYNSVKQSIKQNEIQEQRQTNKPEQNLKKSQQIDQNLIETKIQNKNKTQVIDFKRIRNEDQLIKKQKLDLKQVQNQQNKNIKSDKNQVLDSSQKKIENPRNKSQNTFKQQFYQNQSVPDSLHNGQQINIEKLTEDQLQQIQKLQAVNQQQNQKQPQNQQPIKTLKKQQQTSVTNKHQNQIESARQNFISAQIPIQSLQSLNNYGNFSHRVGHSSRHQNFLQQSQQNQNGQVPANISNYQSLQNVNSSYTGQAQSVSSTVNLQNQQPNKQLLKNLKKQIKNNNEDYYIMQNISNQMVGKLVQSQNSGVQVQNKIKTENNNLLSLSSLFYVNNINLTTSGLNTTKNNKTDKSFENLMSAFTNKKGDPIIQPQIVNQENTNISGNQQINQRKQHSNDSQKPQVQIVGQNTNKRNSKNSIADQKLYSQSLGKNKSNGKQKTLSNSPKNRKPNISDIKKLLSNTTMNPNQVDSQGFNNLSYGTQQKGLKNKSLNKIQQQVNIVPQNGLRAQSKTHRGVGNNNILMALCNRTGYDSTSSAAQQVAVQSNNTKKTQEKMKDLNYLIKTLEKFSKNSASLSTSQYIQGNYVNAMDIAQNQQHNSMYGNNENSQSQNKRLMQSQNQPKIITGFYDKPINEGSLERRNAFRGNGSNGSDPQTPKDFQINFTNQLQNNVSTDNQLNTLGYSQQKYYRSKSNQNSGNNNTRKNGSKSKQNSLLGPAITQQNNNNPQKNQVISQKSKSSMLGMIQVNSGSLNLQNQKNLKNTAVQMQQDQIQKFNQLKQTSDNIQKVLKNNNGFNLSHLNILLNKSQFPQASNSLKNTGAPEFIMNQEKKNDNIDQYISIRNKISHANTQQVQKTKKKGSSGSRSHGRSGTGKTRGMFDLTPDNNFNTSGQIKKNHILADQSNIQLKNEHKKNQNSQKNRSNEQKASYSPPQTQSIPYFENMGLGKHLIEKLQNNNQAINVMNLVSSQREARSVDSKGRSQSTNKSGSQNRKSKKSKKKKFSFSLNQNQPLQLNDLVYSCTQKLDMQKINGNLLMINNDKKGSGSTQNKKLNRQLDMLIPNKIQNGYKENQGSLNLHSQIKNA